jgi:hypothetical protein
MEKRQPRPELRLPEVGVHDGVSVAGDICAYK